MKSQARTSSKHKEMKSFLLVAFVAMEWCHTIQWMRMLLHLHLDFSIFYSLNQTLTISADFCWLEASDFVVFFLCSRQAVGRSQFPFTDRWSLNTKAFLRKKWSLPFCRGFFSLFFLFTYFFYSRLISTINHNKPIWNT